MKTKDVVVNEVDFLVLYDLEEMKQTLNYVLNNNFEEGSSCYKMYSVDHKSTDEEIRSDVEKIEKFIYSIEEGAFDFESAVSKVRKKKNGKFWAKSNEDILVLEYLSEYFTDFTNAWSVLGFRLKVQDDTTVVLELGERTYTY